MPYKEYALQCLSTNVRILLKYSRDKIKTKASESTHISEQESVSDIPAINTGKEENEKNFDLNPFQEDCQRTDFLARLVEKINLDIFDHLL
jgi:hypothetical protein